MARGMTMIWPLALLLLAAPSAPDPGQRHGDQAEAWEQSRHGRILPYKEIERRVVPQMPGARYLGFELDAASAVYTLKFLRDGNVIWVDVNGRSGQIIGRTGR